MIEQFQKIATLIDARQEASLQFEIDGITYIRNFRPQERLMILGAGHIAQPLCRYAADLGFLVTVVDDRPTFANESRFPEATVVLCEPFVEAIEHLNLTAQDYVAVITRGHRYDADCLRSILPLEAFPKYLGMIGSKRRVITLMNMLKEEGFDEQKLNRISAPIGVEINALTVKEIALSIAAQLVQYRRLNVKRHSNQTMLVSEDIDRALLNGLIRDSTPKALLIVFETSGSTPVKSGAMMAINQDYKTWGTIGGGCSEGSILRDAYRMIGTGEQRVFTVDLSNDVAADEGMACGGRMKVLVCDASPAVQRA